MNMHKAMCCGNTNFKAFDLSGPSVYFLFSIFTKSHGMLCACIVWGTKFETNCCCCRGITSSFSLLWVWQNLALQTMCEHRIIGFSEKKDLVYDIGDLFDN